LAYDFSGLGPQIPPGSSRNFEEHYLTSPFPCIMLFIAPPRDTEDVVKCLIHDHA
jgi:hypothetical protein